VELLQRTNNRYGIVIPWYIMTSRENHEYTVNFLKEHEYFGYPEDDVMIFQQEELPLLDKEGKLIVDEDMMIKKASNGNGGVFNSMAKKGVLKDMEKRGISWVFIGGIDNILIRPVDVLLMGLCVKNKTQIAARTVLKSSPEERVGIFCKQNGKVKIIEYTEIPEALAISVNEHGEFIFGDSHIISNLFSINAVKRASTKELQYHVVLKCVDFINEDGELVHPSEPNCYKFEKFSFDAFALFDDISVLRGRREEDFAPIKNMNGENSPETARILYENYWNKRTM